MIVTRRGKHGRVEVDFLPFHSQRSQPPCTNHMGRLRRRGWREKGRRIPLAIVRALFDGDGRYLDVVASRGLHSQHDAGVDESQGRWAQNERAWLASELELLFLFPPH